MNDDLLLLIKEHFDTLIEQTETKQQETLELKMIKQMETFSFSHPINLVEEGKWLLAMTSFEATNSVFNKTNKKNSFSITTPCHWNSESAEKTITELKKLTDFRSENDNDLHVETVRKKGINLIKDYFLSSLSMFKNEILEELKKNKNTMILKIWYIDSI